MHNMGDWAVDWALNKFCKVVQMSCDVWHSKTYDKTESDKEELMAEMSNDLAVPTEYERDECCHQ